MSISEYQFIAAEQSKQLASISRCEAFLTVSQQLLGHQTVLTVAQDEGQEGQDESVHDAHDGQDVGPAHRARPQGVLVCLLAAHPLHLIAVPAVGVDHAAQDQTRTWTERTRPWVSAYGLAWLMLREAMLTDKRGHKTAQIISYKCANG